MCAILGSTYNGEFDDVKALNDQLMELNKKNFASVADTVAMRLTWEAYWRVGMYLPRLVRCARPELAR